MKLSSLLAAIISAWLATPTAASAAVIFNRTATAGASTAQISITTDGTLGLLAQQGASVHNVPAITDWTVTLTTPWGSVSYGKNLLSTRGREGYPKYYGSMFLLGQTHDPVRTVLTSSANTLTFNPGFPAGQNQGLWLNVYDPITYFDQFSYTVQRPNGSNEWWESIGFMDEFGVYRGSRTIYSSPVAFEASGGNLGVPEPATWAMMITGFGLVGAGMRRRKAKLRVRFA